MVNKISNSIAPKHFVTATLLILFLLFVPAGARTYYFDLKSTANKVADNSTAGFSSLRDSTSALMSDNIEGAQESLTNALQNFDQAVTRFKQRTPLVTNYSFRRSHHEQRNAKPAKTNFRRPRNFLRKHLPAQRLIGNSDRRLHHYQKSGTPRHPFIIFLCLTTKLL